MRLIEVMDTCYFFICRCSFLLLFLAIVHGAKWCKVTGDCDNPGLDEFCDEILSACTRCSGYCTGAIDTRPLCLMNCPRKYWIMFRSTTTTDSEQQQEQSTTTADGVVLQTQEQSTTDGQIQEQNSKHKKLEEDSGEQKPEQYFGDKKHEHDTGQATGSNVYVIIIVGTTCGVLLVVAIAVGYRYWTRKGSVSLKDAENHNEIQNSTEMNNMAEANTEAITTTIAETEVTNESNMANEKETEFIAQQADVEPCKEFSQCVPSGMKDTKGENTYLKCPQGHLTETIAEDLKQNTAKPRPAKLQSLGSQSLGNGSTTSFC